jgi:hypothetical protein
MFNPYDTDEPKVMSTIHVHLRDESRIECALDVQRTASETDYESFDLQAGPQHIVIFLRTVAQREALVESFVETFGLTLAD